MRHRWGFIYFNSVACQNSTSRHLGPSLTNHESCHGSGRNAGIKQHSACPQARFWQDHIFLHLVEFFSILRLRPVTVCIRSGWPIFNLNWIYALQVPQLEVFFPDSSRLSSVTSIGTKFISSFFFWTESYIFLSYWTSLKEGTQVVGGRSNREHTAATTFTPGRLAKRYLS